VIRVERTYRDFEDYWTSVQGSPSLKASTANMSLAGVEELKERTHKRLSAAADGSITYPAWAHAVKGRVAK